MAFSPRTHSTRRRLNDLSVGSKLAVGFGSLMLVIVLVIAGMFVALNKLEAVNDGVEEVANARAVAAARLNSAAADLRAEQQTYVFDPIVGRALFNAAASRFEAALENLRRSGGDAVDQALVTKIATGYQTFLATDQIIVAAVEDGNATLAENLTLGAEKLAFGFMAADAKAFAERAEEHRLDAEQLFADTETAAHTMGIVLGVTALVLTAIAGIVITRLIRNPLLRVQQAAERAADGDLDAIADVTSNDETGRLAAAFNSMLAKLRVREQALLTDHQRQESANRVHRALEMSDDEAAALEVVALSLAHFLPNASAEMLLADNSKSNLEQAVVAGPTPHGPGCPVASPFSCVAVRSGAAVTFPSSTALDACPHLRERGVEPCSAVCVPVSFMGRAIGVIHAVNEHERVAPQLEIEDLSMLATQTGTRIGMLRTMVRTQVQVSTDSLTGMANRRTFESRVRNLRRAGTPFTLVMADIDHFKRVNDSFGHQAGDRALKAFTDVAKAAIRESDVAARWGGEEFAFAFPELDTKDTCTIIDRMRVELSAKLSTSDLPGFTVSFGIAAAGDCATLEDAIRFADDALYEAKANGRNCYVVANTQAAQAPKATRAPKGRVAERAKPSKQGALATLLADDEVPDSDSAGH
jgi:diguanylate cyclase (GGDEF)-like protein